MTVESVVVVAFALSVPSVRHDCHDQLGLGHWIVSKLNSERVYPTSDAHSALTTFASLHDGFLWCTRMYLCLSSFISSSSRFVLQTLTDLNDYITPSQACIKPVEQIGGSSNNTPEPGAASVRTFLDITTSASSSDLAQFRFRLRFA